MLAGTSADTPCTCIGGRIDWTAGFSAEPRRSKASSSSPTPPPQPQLAPGLLHSRRPVPARQVVPLQELAIVRHGRRRVPRRLLDPRPLEQRGRGEDGIRRTEEAVKLPKHGLMPPEQPGRPSRVARGEEPAARGQAGPRNEKRRGPAATPLAW